MPRLALFDLDNTLLDRVGVFRRWATAWAAERGIDGALAVPWLESADEDGMVGRTGFFARVKQHFGLPDSVDELVPRYTRDYPGCVHPAPASVRDALAELRRNGYRVGIVTNGPPSQEAKIAHMELGDLVDGWAVSALVGAAKPSPSIFRAAALACGVDGDGWWEGGWMVGDNPQADVAGAQACGLGSVWIDRGYPWPDDLPEPDFVATGTVEAVRIILDKS